MRNTTYLAGQWRINPALGWSQHVWALNTWEYLVWYETVNFLSPELGKPPEQWHLCYFALTVMALKPVDQTIFKVGNGAMSASFPISPVMLEWDFRTPFLLRFFDTKSSFLCLSLSSLLARISRGGEKEHVRGNPRILDKIKVSWRRFDVYNTCRRLIKRSQWALMLWIPECKAAFRVPVFDFKAW